MKRRTMLKSAVAGLTLGALPWGLREAFASGGEACDAKQEAARIARLTAAAGRARRLGRPLLVLLVPEDPTQIWERGLALGSFLNHATEAELAPLALCEVVCGRAGDLARLAPTLEIHAAAPAALVETSGGGRHRAPPLTLPEYPPWRGFDLEDGPAPREKPRPEAEISEERIRLVAAHLAELIVPDARAVARRGAEAEARAGALAVVATLEAVAAGGSPGVPELERVAGALYRAAAEGRARAARVHALCAEVVRERVVRRPPPGSRWASSSGCGTTYEETPEERAAREAAGRMRRVVMFGCGMGHVPVKGRRFLSFLTQRSEDDD